MTITQRVIAPHSIPTDAYKDQKEIVLESVAAYKMVNLLSQISQLSEFAADIFDSLYKEAGYSSQRVSLLGSRIHSMDVAVPNIEKVFASNPPTYFYQSARGRAWARQDYFAQSLFDPRTQPSPIQKARALASPPPNVSLLDALSKKSCLRDYSNPLFFFEQWVIAEEERQKKLIEENRNKKKDQKGKKKKKKVVKEVQKVQIKTFSAMGAEFAPTQQQQQQQQHSEPKSRPEAKEEEERS